MLKAIVYLPHVAFLTWSLKALPNLMGDRRDGMLYWPLPTSKEERREVCNIMLEVLY